MMLVLTPSRPQIAGRRQERYLEAWSLEAQAEAHAEAAAGRPQKLEQMVRDFARIRQELPYEVPAGSSEGGV